MRSWISNRGYDDAGRVEGVLALLAATIIISILPTGTPAPKYYIPEKTRTQEIEEGCYQQFYVDGNDAVMRCKTELMTRVILQDKADRLEKATN